MKKFFCVALSVLSLAYLPIVSVGATYAEKSVKRYGDDIALYSNYAEVVKRDIYYSTKTDNDKYQNPYEAPTFSASRSDACVVNAGGNAIVYYDVIYDDLIPGYSHTYVWGEVFSYGVQNEAVTNMFGTLFEMMGSDPNRGTTIDGFKSGMTQYASSRGYGISITSATGNYYGVNLNYLKSQLKAENMAVIFLDTFNVIDSGDIEPHDGYDNITYYKHDGLHAMLVYGYREIYYYDVAGELTERDTYLYVSTGYSGIALGYLDITHFCQVEDIYIVEVI